MNEERTAARQFALPDCPEPSDAAIRLVPVTLMMDCLDRRRWPIVRRSELLRRFITEDRGQDVVEYAFIGVFIGIAGWLTLQAIDDAVLATYSSWIDPSTGTPSVWEPADPIVVP